MFRISMQDQAGPVGMFGDGLAHFHAVSRSLATHWYHVSLKRRHDERFMAYEEMVSDEPRLVELLISQDESMVIKEVQVVTPAWMNKGSSWKMEKLTSLSMGFNQVEVPICVLQVESGDVYVNTHQRDLDIDSLVGLKELYRRSVATTQEPSVFGTV
ncbi:hypothetical protein H8F21_07000 [Pseudomonas sp. P66]|uniref:Uncharacterized protein n=1 Tax=Pseudomonas arcuscaelestis TaxID=2710591 RepID=A0ABS2BUM3_9PSED|nr:MULTISPECIES: hypothetical protein [Pseudomonas]MBH3416808.1 hypothetical protein [Pseudomonas putida]MBM5457317.1 hypothetical protein [Pseudomonas arcuscaelestis]MDG9816112.1 hypothetical protein [Pseudomonas putida]NMX27630.1 hypothetical protein [Pseudomonas sp. WS 5406]NNB13400.1 hypothetical protein [Pseudomonas fragi]